VTGTIVGIVIGVIVTIALLLYEKN